MNLSKEKLEMQRHAIERRRLALAEELRGDAARVREESYGALADANGVWTLDIAETTTLVFTIVDIDIDNKIFFCKFHSTALS